jgi:hypothetical protein
MAFGKVYARKAKFSQTSGHWFISISITFDNSQDMPSLEPREYKRAADIEADMRALHERLKREFPEQSHYVSCILRRGDRKPNGYNNLPKLEYNAERDRQIIEAAIDSAVIELAAAGIIDRDAPLKRVA